uniref:Uncharacterized protein LOC117350859 n=1 Tax=Geotrypetes seraphini TaxID=260995 RepID=A0A6P8Q2C5_GEOSA|nr:uncharacterized protein LOC117350859 [Geotrypetes seraphini]
MAQGSKEAYSISSGRKKPFQERITESSLLVQRFPSLHTLASGDALFCSQGRSCQQEGPQEDDTDRETIRGLEKALFAAQTQAQEKERALKEQEKSFVQRMENAARNRDHLEEERFVLLRQKLEQEKEEALRVERHRAELETQLAVEAALAALRTELLGEVRQEMLRDAELTQGEQMKVAFLETTEERRKQEEKIAALEWQYAQEIQSMKDTTKELQTEVHRLTKEKMDYESAFQELQLNYKRFIDLTDSSLHSDYLLRLRHLGRPPGRAVASTQTESTDKLQEGSWK